MNDKDILIEAQYFPPIPFFIRAIQSNHCSLEAFENYQKGSFRNRCYILGANGVLRLSIPLESGKHQKLPIQEVKISYTENWVTNHIQSIRSAYGNAPYFIYYFDQIKELIEEKHHSLFELNRKSIQLMIDELDLPIHLENSSSFIKTTESMIDLRNTIKPSTVYQTNVLNSSIPSYEQVLSRNEAFIPSLSILDLMFNKGLEAHSYLVSLLDHEIYQ